MKRIILILSIASLLVALALVALWIRSFWYFDQVTWNQCRVSGLGYHLKDGTIWFDHGISIHLRDFRWNLTSEQEARTYRELFASGPSIGFRHERLKPSIGRRLGLLRWTLIGFYFRIMPPPAYARGGGWDCAFPFWVPIAAFAILPAFRLRSFLKDRRRRRRILAGCCSECGYDLRASIDRCPECGQAIPATCLSSTLPR